MSEYIEVRSMEEVAYLLNVLFTNLNNLDRTYYDMFINPVPMDIELQRYDENGVLTTVILPNRAKDRITTYSGEGNPNGKCEASTGALYIDTVSKNMFYKGSGSDAYGWISIFSANSAGELNFLTPDGDASQLKNLNVNSVTAGVLKVINGGTGVDSITGIVKGNGTEPFSEAEPGVDYMAPETLRGLVVYYPTDSIPNGWLRCDGSAIPRDTYRELYNIIGTTYGAGNGSTTFNLPDLRDIYIKGWNGTRQFGQVEQGHTGSHTHPLSGRTGAGSKHSHGKGTYYIKGVAGTCDIEFNPGTYEADPYKNGNAAKVKNYITVSAANNPFYRKTLSGYSASVRAGKMENDHGEPDPIIFFNTNRGDGSCWGGNSGEENTHTHPLSGTTGSAGSGDNTVTNLAMVPIIKY